MTSWNREKNIQEIINIAIIDSGYKNIIPEPEKVESIPYNALPSTACWIQYMIAQSYVASFNSGSLAKPDLGDQVDYRHAAFAGLSDIFVSGDKRMREILNDYVLACKAKVMSPEEYLEFLND